MVLDNELVAPSSVMRAASATPDRLASRRLFGGVRFYPAAKHLKYVGLILAPPASVKSSFLNYRKYASRAARMTARFGLTALSASLHFEIAGWAEGGSMVELRPLPIRTQHAGCRQRDECKKKNNRTYFCKIYHVHLGDCRSWV